MRNVSNIFCSRYVAYGLMMKQHMEAIRDYSKHMSNAFGKHIGDEHAGNEIKFKVDIIKYLHSPLRDRSGKGWRLSKPKQT